ncbi:MAG TPA: Dabb family protein [Cyclobacteriaceae bacterium]|nr:Dabb family protein [Cyclobacteriaceae bacterium]
MNTRRKFMALALGLGLGVFVPKKLTAVQPAKKPMLVHQVFFWLKKPNKDLKAVMKGCKEIGQIKSALSYQVGVPAATAKRDVIDGSYHIALTVNFKSIADHDVYQEDPVHLKFIADHKDKWEKVQIYDFEVE